MLTEANFLIKIYNYSDSDKELIQSLLGNDYFSTVKKDLKDLSLTVDVDGITAKRIIDYWNDNDCEFDLEYRIKKRRKR